MCLFICHIMNMVTIAAHRPHAWARWPSGLRRSIKEDILSNQEDLLSSGVGSNPTLVITPFFFAFGEVSFECLLNAHDDGNVIGLRMTLCTFW